MSDLLQTYTTTSWHMTAVIVVWLLLRLVLRGRVPARLVAFGWVIIIAGLLLPWRWSSPLSPFNWLPLNLAQPVATDDSPSASAAFSAASTVPAVQIKNPPSTPVPLNPGTSSPFPDIRAIAASLWHAHGVSVWFGGMLTLVGLRLWRWVLGLRLVGRQPAATSPALTALVAACARELSLRGPIRVCEADAIHTPAIWGLRRPTLLFPTGFLEKMTAPELRLVIMHELGHWCRRDLWLHELIFLVRALHWFNPLVWLAARLSRDDAEAACDEFVMRRMSSRDVHAYGAALLKVLGVVRGQTGCLVGLGIFGHKPKLQQRIKMIAQYQPAGACRTLVGVAALAMLLVVSLTRELHAQATAPVAPEVTNVAPAGWWRNGQNAGNYTVGIDSTQPHIRPTSAYVRSNGPGKGNDFGGMMQAFDADDYHGKRLRFSAWMKTKDALNGAQLWMRVDGKTQGQSLQFDNMDRRPHPMGTTDWQFCEVVLDVPPEATAVALGFFIKQTGQAWVNDAKLEVVDESVAVTDMNTSKSGRKLPAGPANLEFAATR